MRKTSVAKAIAGTLVIGASIGSAHGQTPAVSQYPSKAIHVIASGPGGTIDFGARMVAEGLKDVFKQGVIVENRAAGVIPGQTVARARPDGYTLLFTGGSFWVTQLLRDDVPYDPVKDFAPISLVHEVPYVLVVHQSVPVNSAKELIALAKARPGQINYGSGSPGSASTLAGALFAYMADINMVPVPYKAAGARQAAMLIGEVHVDFASGAGYASYAKSGKIRALGITSKKPSKVFPDLRPVAETVPGYESSSTSAMFAPAKTPAAIINRLNQEVVKALNRADIKAKFEKVGADVTPSSPQELADHMKSEIDRVGKVIKAAGLRVK